ncbi:MAG: CPBP family intramembrane metalloprotease [Halanaerobiaceae bacterium]|nr:CPBP family intramembrane metalloprotease [Halanaerobiaceae bacterium]
MGEKGRHYPNIIQSIGLTGLVMLVMGLYGFILGLFFELAGMEYDMKNPVIYSLQIIGGVVFSIGGIIYYVMKRKGLSLKEIKGANIKDIVFYNQVFLSFVGLYIVVHVLGEYIEIIFPKSDFYNNLIEGLMGQNIVLVFIATCIVAPIFEETFFRGIILRGLLKNTRHWIAISLSSLLFAIFHLNIWQGIIAFITGIFIGWIFYKTASLFIAIFANFVINCTNLIIFNSLITISGYSNNNGIGFQTIWFILIGLFLCIVGMLLIGNSKRYSDSDTI